MLHQIFKYMGLLYAYLEVTPLFGISTIQNTMPMKTIYCWEICDIRRNGDIVFFSV